MKNIWNEEITSHYHQWNELYDGILKDSCNEIKLSFVILRFLGGIPLCLSNNSKVVF